MLQKFAGPLVSVATVCVMFYVWLSVLDGHFVHVPVLVTGFIIGIVYGANFFARLLAAKTRHQNLFVWVAIGITVLYLCVSVAFGILDHVPAFVTGGFIGIIIGVNLTSRKSETKARRLISRQPKFVSRRSQMIAHRRQQGPKRRWRMGLQPLRSRRALI